MEGQYPQNVVVETDRESGLLTRAQLHFLDLILHHHIRIPQMCPFNMLLLPRMPEAVCCSGFFISARSGNAGAVVAGREG